MASKKLQIHQILTSPDNIHVRYGIYGSKKKSAPLILFVLGRGEWVEKYLPLYTQLHKKLGSTIVCVDHIGQGGSGGIAAHIDSYNDYLDPMIQVLEHEFPSRSYSIVAHSMGGLIALYGVLKQGLHPEKMVLSSPLIGLPQKPVPRLLARPISERFASLGLTHTRTLVKSEIAYSFRKNRLTGDREKYQFFQKTPYPIPAPTMGWVQATFEACQSIHYDYHLSKLNVPLLIFYGTHEHVVSAPSIKRWVKITRKLSDSTIELVHIPDAHHEIFFELEDLSQQAMRRTLDFLKLAPHGP